LISPQEISSSIHLITLAYTEAIYEIYLELLG